MTGGDGDGASARPGARAAVAAIVLVGDDLTAWWASLFSLIRSGVAVLALSPISRDVLLDGRDMEVAVRDWTLPQALDILSQGEHTAIAVVTAPVVVPPAAFDRARGFAEQDGRVCTISFLSNNAGYLSFPDRNAPSGLMPPGHDEATVTTQLRGSARFREPVPIPVPAGSCVVVPSIMVRSLGGLRSSIADPDVAVVDLALRGVERGFLNVLDSATFLTTPTVADQKADVREDPGARDRLHRAHPFFPSLYDVEKNAPGGPLADVLYLRKAELVGVDLLIDGSCFGPHETGTQVAVLANIRALTGHPLVRRVVVPIPSPQPPGYAIEVLRHPKVLLTRNEACTFPDAPTVDIIHRPFQPHGPLPLDRWAQIGRRLVITIQDLIAYNNGYYHRTGLDWLTYRSALAQTLVGVDSVVAISADTADSIRGAGLLPFAGKVSVIPNGTDHLSGMQGRLSVPKGLLDRGSAAARFALVLGTSYAHKNRDLAIRAWHELRRRGHQLELVMAGVTVPEGSTRNEEVLAASGGPDPIVLADVSDAERNWLLRHASVVVYPTSAEGFGLVPFEAAEFDTPTVFVSFGPLAEFLDRMPVVAREWTPTALADAIASVASDPGVASAQVAAVKKVAGELTWDSAADQLIEAYLDALSRPSGRPG